MTIETLVSMIYNTDEPSKILFFADKILTIDPANLDAIAYRAIGYQRMKDYSAALKEYAIYLEKRPYSSFYAYRARLKLMMGDTLDALQDVDKALSVSGYNEEVSEDIAKFWPNDKLVVPYFEKVIKLHPNQTRAYTILGIAKEKKRDFAGAEKEYARAILALEKNIFWGREKLRWVYDLKADMSFQLKHYPEAVEAITQLILLSPDDVRYYKDRINYYRAAGQDFNACEDMMQVQKMDKNYSPVFKINCDSTKRDVKKTNAWLARVEAEKFYLKALSFKGSDSASTRKAILNFSKALELQPDHIYSLAGLAAYYSISGRYDEGILKLSKILKIDPKSAMAFHYRAIAKRTLNDYKGAIKDEYSAIHFDSTNTEYRVNLAAMESDMGDTSKAIIDLTQALELDSLCHRAYFERGILEMFARKEYVKALSDFTKAIEIQGNNPFDKRPATYYYYRAIAYDKLTLYQRSINDLDRAIALKPKIMDYYYLSGEVKARIKDMDGACKDWNLAKQLGSKKAEEVLLYNCGKPEGRD